MNILKNRHANSTLLSRTARRQQTAEIDEHPEHGMRLTGGIIKPFSCIVCVLVLATSGNIAIGSDSAGITPEQIFQTAIDWETAYGTWEAIPEDHPLSENAPRMLRRHSGALLTLRRDGTCRMFDQDHPSGADGIWTFENHAMYIKLKGGRERDLYVYGIKGDFMVTRSPVKGGKDQLWSRIPR